MHRLEKFRDNKGKGAHRPFPTSISVSSELAEETVLGARYCGGGRIGHPVAPAAKADGASAQQQKEHRSKRQPEAYMM